MINPVRLLLLLGSYYSGTRDDDSAAFVKNELLALDDSETSICDLDPEQQHGPELYPDGAVLGVGGVHDAMFVSSPHMLRGPPPGVLHHSAPLGSGAGQGLGPNMTPIDKLYSMQNSYFTSGSAPSECEC